MSDRKIEPPLYFEPAGDGMGACIHDATGAIICEAKYSDFADDVTEPERAMKMMVGATALRPALEAARSEIVLTISFLGRDAGTSRQPDTIADLIKRLCRADSAARTALNLSEARAIENARADAKAVWRLADQSIPADIREAAERWQMKETLIEIWRGAFIEGWRAANRGK